MRLANVKIAMEMLNALEGLSMSKHNLSLSIHVNFRPVLWRQVVSMSELTPEERELVWQDWDVETF